MRIRGKIEDVQDIEVTLSITMRLSEWEELQKVLPEKYPHWKLGSAISSASFKLAASVNEEIEEN